MIHDYGKTVRQSTGDAHGAAKVQSTSKNKSNKISQDSSKRGSRAGRRRAQQENLQALLPHLMKMLGTSMEERLKECAVSEDNAACTDRCFQALQAVVEELGPRWRLEVFGSVASGFRTSASDMDATCVQAAAEDDEEESPVAPTILQERLSPLLRQHEKFQVIEEIVHAKVPILRLRFEGHLDIDLSCQNTAALLNTRLLSAYAKLHPRVRELGIAVKLWAKAAHVCGAAKGNLSSYSFTLLVIYFMQVHNEVNLPCLPTSLFKEDAAVVEEKLESIRSSWSCRLTLADLFFRFIGFYQWYFEWGHEVVSVRNGWRLPPRDDTFRTLRGRYVSRLHIEDPYALERNLHCVLGEAEEVQLREAFQSAWCAIINQITPVGLRPLGHGWGKVEIELDKHTLTDDGLEKETFDDVEKPDTSWAESDSTVDEKKASVGDSPLTFSSSGSTESGDDKSGPHAPPSSSGDSRQSDDDCMTVDKDIAATNSKQWWHNLSSANVAEAVSSAVPSPEKHQEKEHRPRIISLEDLESRMAQDPSTAYAAPAVQTLFQEAEVDACREQAPLSSMTKSDVAQLDLENMARRIMSKVKRTQIPTSDSAPSVPPSIKAESCELKAPMVPVTASPAGGASMWWLNLGSDNVKQAVEASGQEEEGGRWSRRKRGLKQQGVTVQDLEGKMIQDTPQDLCDLDSREVFNPSILPIFGGSFASTASSKIASRVANRCLIQA
jgi:DNA polymerase sigma